MREIFLVSDTHFGHAGVCRFLGHNGKKLRPWDDVLEMDEEMVKLWNDKVSPNDKVYHLGDVVLNRRSLNIVDRLNGNKVLIKGNHDVFKLEEYARFFKDIRASHVLDGLIFTHIPVHKLEISRFGINIHGHIHDKRILIKNGDNISIDTDYHCVSVEQTSFSPISFDEVLERIKNEKQAKG